MANKLNIDGIMLFEQPFVRVPYENYRKVFRSSQKLIQRELGIVHSASAEILKKGKSPADFGRSIDTMIEHTEDLKRKLAVLNGNAGKMTLDVMRERFEHLAAVEGIQNANCPEFDRWADTRLNRWLVDWALRNGKAKTATMLATDRGITTLVDLDLFDDITRIERDLSEHHCTGALAWCYENKSALRKIKNNLEFDLRLQEYIELCRQGNNTDAIAYSKRHLLSWKETHMHQIQQAAVLLAFPPTTSCPPYKRLYDPSRWDNLIKMFRTSIYSLNLLSDEPLLNLALFAGLSSLKLRSCYHQPTKNVDCPVCDVEGNSDSRNLGLGKLAEEVPFSYHANSTLVCQITGKIMDHDNMPMAFPNGYIYSREAMEDMALKNGGEVKCPRTGETCSFSTLRKVFIS